MIVAGTLTNKMAPALRKVLVDAMVQVVKKCFDFFCHLESLGIHAYT